MGKDEIASRLIDITQRYDPTAAAKQIDGKVYIGFTDFDRGRRFHTAMSQAFTIDQNAPRGFRLADISDSSKAPGYTYAYGLEISLKELSQHHAEAALASLSLTVGLAVNLGIDSPTGYSRTG